MAIDVSIILCCLNEAKRIHNQLDALAGQKWQKPWEVVVSDNGSTDGTQAIVEGYRDRLPNLVLIDSSERAGPGYARNAAIAAASGDKLLFCDADDVVGPGWLTAMATGLEQHDFVACRADFAKLNPPWLLAARNGTQEKGLQSYDYPPFLPHAAGGTIGLKRYWHERIGGIDETMLRLQDTDYCWRLQLAGAELHFVPDAVVYYRLRPDMKTTCRQARLWGEYNVLLYKKYRRHGMPRLSRVTGVRNMLGLLRRSVQLLNRERRPEWLWDASWATGRLIGSIKHRIFAL